MPDQSAFERTPEESREHRDYWRGRSDAIDGVQRQRDANGEYVESGPYLMGYADGLIDAEKERAKRTGVLTGNINQTDAWFRS